MTDNNATETISPQVRRHDICAIILIGFAHASSHFYHLVFPSLLPWLMPAFGLDFTQASLMITVFFIVSALGQFCAGFFVDKAGPKAGLFTGLALLGLSSLVLGVATGPVWLLVSSILAGMGNAVFHPSDYSLINYNISKPMLGQAFAWHGITGSLGWAVCPLLMTGLAGLFDWRVAAFASAAIAFGILAALIVFGGLFPNDQTNEKKTAKGEEGGSMGFLRIPSVWLCFFFFFFTTAAFGTFKSYAGPLFGQTYGLDLAAASTALTCYVAGSMAGNFAGGFLTSRVRLDADRIVCLSMGFAALIAFVLASQVLHGWWAIVMMTLIGLGSGLAGPSRDIMIRTATIGRLGLKGMGRVYGFTYCGMDVGQALTPLVFGPMLDAGFFTGTLVGIALLQTAAIATAVGVGNQNRQAPST